MFVVFLVVLRRLKVCKVLCRIMRCVHIPRSENWKLWIELGAVLKCLSNDFGRSFGL